MSAAASENDAIPKMVCSMNLRMILNVYMLKRIFKISPSLTL